jgi:hypothetical protein
MTFAPNFLWNSKDPEGKFSTKKMGAVALNYLYLFTRTPPLVG